MKKIFSLLLVLFVLSAATHSFAAGTATVTLNKVTATAGDTVDITVSLANNPGIVAMQLAISYDKSVLTLTGITDAGVLGGQTHTKDYTLNPYKLTWEDGLADENNESNGIIATLHFAINSNAEAKEYALGVKCTSGNTYNYDLDDVEFETVNGSITVTSGGGEDDGEPTISAPVSVVQGNNVTIAAELTGTANGGKIIGAMYDASGNMIECHLYDPAQTVNVVFTKSGGSYAEIYWWEDMTSITPVCKNETVAILAAN